MRKLWNKRLADMTVGDMTKTSIYGYGLTMALVVGAGIVLDHKAKRSEKRQQLFTEE